MRNRQAKRRALERDTEASMRKEKDRVSIRKKRTLETDTEAILRKEKVTVSMAKN